MYYEIRYSFDEIFESKGVEKVKNIKKKVLVESEHIVSAIEKCTKEVGFSDNFNVYSAKEYKSEHVFCKKENGVN